MKKLALGLSVCATAFIIGCGGGSSKKTQVTASVEASVVKGATVCELNTNNCAISDVNGKVSLYVTKLPVELEVKIKNLVLGKIEANSKSVSINPITLSNNNEALALKIGAFIHALVGDINDSKNLVDLSNITITTNINDSIVNLLKEDKVFTINVNNHSIKVSDKVYIDNSPVSYSLDKFVKISNVDDFINYIKNKYGISNIDKISTNDISGQTWYTEEDINETVKFNSDGTFSDSWVEDGKTYTKTGNWNIDSNVIVLNYDTDDYGGVKKVFTAFSGDKAFVVYLDKDNNILGEGDEYPKVLVDDLVAGKVTLYDENGSQINVPENAKIRITPSKHGDWHGVNCIINDDGTFGNECFIEVNENNMKNALESETSQIIVYDDKNNNNEFDGSDSGEKAYGFEDVNITDLKNIDVNVTVYN